MSERVHVTPTWEKHDESPDCWCEPSIREDGRLVIHHAKHCKDGLGHTFMGGECILCGQSERCAT